MDATATLRNEVGRIDEEIAALRDHLERLTVERHVVVDLLRRIAGDSGEKVGPTQAVRELLERHPGLTRRELLDQAVPVVTTAPPLARKTVAQTILNLLNSRKLEEREGKLYLANTNSHSG